MSTPREVLPGRTYMITRRCTQRQFLMRPDPETNNAFIYCLAEAAARYRIEIIFTVAMSNHHHTGHLRPRRELSGVPRALSQALRQVPERAARPLGELLVLRTDQRGQTGRARRCARQDGLRPDEPREGRAGREGPPLARRDVVGSAPARVDAVGDAPEALLPRRRVRCRSQSSSVSPNRVASSILSDEELAKLILERVRARGGERRDRTSPRWDEGPRPQGRARAAVERPARKPEPRRALDPRVAARSQWSRLEAILRNRSFRDAYAAARASFIAGVTNVLFPAGTYWLHRFVNAPCEPHLSPS